MAANKSLILEVKGLEKTIKDLHCKVAAIPLNIPSWKYPGKSATEVDINSLLEDMQSLPLEQQRSLLLELLVDRLLLLLQSIYYVAMDTGRQRCNVPLTFGTVARKLLKLIISNREKKQEADVTCQSHTSNGGSVVDSSSQTIETSFMTCDQCSDKTAVLLLVTSGLSEVCREVCGVCEKRECRVGDGREREWLGYVNKDLNMLKTHNQRQVSKELSQRATIQSQDGVITDLQVQCDNARENLVTLEAEVATTKSSWEARLGDTEMTYTAKINELSTRLTSEVIKSEVLLQQVTSLKSIQSELREKIAAQNEDITHLTELVQIKETNESNLENKNDKLNEQVTSLQLTIEEERRLCKELSRAIEEKAVLLKKAQAQVGNLNKKCKSLLVEQTTLVGRIRELDEECVQLNARVEEIQREKCEIDQQLFDTSCKITQYDQELSMEKENKSLLIAEKVALEGHITSLVKQLEEELHSKHLLMDYPFATDIAHLPTTVDRSKCIKANVVRILLLEEQNIELRRVTRRQLITTDNKPLQLIQPIKLWQQPVLNHTPPTKPSLRGRLGHLVTALSHVTGPENDWARQDSLDMCTCPHCDVMCSNELELNSHVCDIETM